MRLRSFSQGGIAHSLNFSFSLTLTRHRIGSSKCSRRQNIPGSGIYGVVGGAIGLGEDGEIHDRRAVAGVGAGNLTAYALAIKGFWGGMNLADGIRELVTDEYGGLR